MCTSGSLAILGVFLVENILLGIANGLRYFGEWRHALDLCVVVLSLGLELGEVWVWLPQEQNGVLILIIARLWRFGRIGHGVYEECHEEYHEDGHGEVHQKKNVGREEWKLD